jgi:protein SCO1/2
MQPIIKKRLKRIAVLTIIGLLIGAGMGWLQIQTQNARVITKEGRPADSALPIAGVQVGGPFSLLVHNNTAVTEKNYDGQYKLIYFGFTYCPAICPTELQKMTLVMNELSADGDQIQPLFITIDPARDTVETMRSYVSLFHPRLVGLTGTQPQIDLVLNNYRVFAAKSQQEGLSDYTMDHSSFTYLMAPDNSLMAVYRIEDTADFMAEDIQKRLNDSSLL